VESEVGRASWNPYALKLMVDAPPHKLLAIQVHTSIIRRAGQMFSTVQLTLWILLAPLIPKIKTFNTKKLLKIRCI
jgi:hypothetical protein